MKTIGDREAKRALWLKHWQDWSASGESFAEYARRHELDVDEGYRWKRILQRAGLLPEQLRRFSVDEAAKTSKPGVVRFARVRIESAQKAEAPVPLRLHLVLTNGRRAELIVHDESQLLRLLNRLEQPA
jgi:hypothetical protein